MIITFGTFILFLLCMIALFREIRDVIQMYYVNQNHQIQYSYGDKILSIFLILMVSLLVLGAHLSLY